MDENLKNEIYDSVLNSNGLNNEIYDNVLNSNGLNVRYLSGNGYGFWIYILVKNIHRYLIISIPEPMDSKFHHTRVQ
jgi:hypothetical protein